MSAAQAVIGRPPSDDPRVVLLKVYVTPDEAASIRAEAVACGHADGRGSGVGAYLRSLHLAWVGR